MIVQYFINIKRMVGDNEKQLCNLLSSHVYGGLLFAVGTDSICSWIPTWDCKIGRPEHAGFKLGTSKSAGQHNTNSVLAAV